MNSMQYKITLPNDYDMTVIRERVRKNGAKTDGFEGLLFKAYLIIDSADKKQYAPLYIWKDSVGMNKFIFEGYYDNILKSFGWQKINIGVPLDVHMSTQFSEAKYVFETVNSIEEATNISYPTFLTEEKDCVGKVLVYNPDKWNYTAFYFYKEVPTGKNTRFVYEILHLSM